MLTTVCLRQEASWLVLSSLPLPLSLVRSLARSLVVLLSLTLFMITVADDRTMTWGDSVGLAWHA